MTPTNQRIQNLVWSIWTPSIPSLPPFVRVLYSVFFPSSSLPSSPMEEVIRRACHAGSWYSDHCKRLWSFFSFLGIRWCWCLKLLLWRFRCCFVAGKLDEELENWLRACGVPKSSDVRGVIAPWVCPFFSLLGRIQSLILWIFASVSLFWCRHAGYSYSGRCAAFAFGNIDPSSMSVCLFLFFSIATFFSMYENFSVSTGEVYTLVCFFYLKFSW